MLVPPAPTGGPWRKTRGRVSQRNDASDKQLPALVAESPRPRFRALPSGLRHGDIVHIVPSFCVRPRRNISRTTLSARQEEKCRREEKMWLGMAGWIRSAGRDKNDR